jgi:hypothetical protein
VGSKLNPGRAAGRDRDGDLLFARCTRTHTTPAGKWQINNQLAHPRSSRNQLVYTIAANAFGGRSARK